MSDTREAILVRLLATSTGAGGFVTAVRNRDLLSTEKRPACILLDGDEAPALVHPRSGRISSGRIVAMTPQIMVMRPQLFILLEEKANAQHTVIGPETNAARIRLIRAIAEDEQLLLLLGSNGGVVYNGCETDMKSGSPMKGQMRLDFAFTYTYFPTTNQQGAS